MYTFSGSIEYDGSHLLQSWRLIAATNDRLRARIQSRKAELEAALDVDRRRRRRKRSATELDSFRGTSACADAVLAFFLSLFGYVQSACFSGSGSACAVSSPRGRRSLHCTCCLLSSRPPFSALYLLSAPAHELSRTRLRLSLQGNWRRCIGKQRRSTNLLRLSV